MASACELKTVVVLEAYVKDIYDFAGYVPGKHETYNNWQSFVEKYPNLHWGQHYVENKYQITGPIDTLRELKFDLEKKYFDR